MFLTSEENRRLTQVGPGTDGGNLLRRYWHPIAGLHVLSDQHPTHFVRLLGEDLVLFRDKAGRVGLLADHCAHRGASLLYGRVEERGIACAYHGWLYDGRGNCLETPAEPAGSRFHLSVKQRAYPVERLFGLYWAYLGPAPAPPIRRLDVMDYPIEHVMETQFDANWVQVVENNLDGAHIYILHQNTMSGHREPCTSTTRGLIHTLVSLDYNEVSFGIMRRMVTADGYLQEDPMIFPNMLRRLTELSIKVPVDDCHTKKYVIFVNGERPNPTPNDEPSDYYVFPPNEAKSAADCVYPDATYRMDKLRYQDVMAIETQGPVTDRASWHPATTDRGVAMFDRLLLRQMDRVRDGLDPIGVTCEADAVIDTNMAAMRIRAGTAPVPQGVLVHQRRRSAVLA